jgi:hypothetical protein
MGISLVPSTPHEGLTLLSTTTLSGVTTTISNIPQNYRSLYLVVTNMINATAAGTFRIAPNGSTNKVNSMISYKTSTTAVAHTDYLRTATSIQLSSNNQFIINIHDYNTTAEKILTMQCSVVASNEGRQENCTGVYFEGLAITSLVFSNSGGNLSSGTIKLYGVN